MLQLVSRMSEEPEPADGVRPMSRSLQIAISAFLCLSVADLVVTWKLVALDDNEVAEINPVASCVLETLGWPGMAAYKATLVAAVVSLISAICARRPRAGESVITFGCGVQSAIVISGLLLCNGKGQHADANSGGAAADIRHEVFHDLPPHGWRLLKMKSVQRELMLSAAYLAEIADQENRVRTFEQRHFIDNNGERLGAYAEVLGGERQLCMLLHSWQRKRLWQLSWQLRGARAVEDQQVAATLYLTEEQSSQVFEFVEIDEPFGNSDEARLHKRFWSILDARQRQAWLDLLGAPFSFDSTTADAEPLPWHAGSD